MTAFFDLTYFIFSLFYLPVFLKKIRQAANPAQLFRERLGIFPGDWKERFSGKRLLWIHAVSVGEVMAVRKFIQELLARQPGLNLILTTVTPTGQKIAKEMEGERLAVLYFPFDFSFACGKFFETFRPQGLLLAETEIWPNLLIQAKKFQVLVGILNARLSEKSVRRYGRLNFLFRPLFEGLNFVLAQTQEDADRFVSLGVSPERVNVAGSMKFDNVPLAASDPSAVISVKQEWHFRPEDEIWIAGSTHPKEEEIVLRTFCRLRDSFPQLKMILAPRHIERSEGIAAQARKLGLKTVLATDQPGKNFDVLVLNQLGILKQLYQIATVVYVGGSLVKRGGQNPIEPAIFQKPIVHGPHIFNFEKIYRDLDQEGGALMVQDEAQLISAVRRLLANPPDRAALGQRAFEKVQSLQGATQRHLEWVSHFMMVRSQERTGHEQFHEKLFPSSGGRV